MQVECRIEFSDRLDGPVCFTARGLADVVKDDVVYELKFVSELTHEHFLQCASYMVAMQMKKGILWNTRDNTAYEITVPDRTSFLDALARAVTKGLVGAYYEPSGKLPLSSRMHGKQGGEQGDVKKTEEMFAVIDVETNWNDEVMAIGVVIAGSDQKPLDSHYYIITPEYEIGGMYSSALKANGQKVPIADRRKALKQIKACLDVHDVRKIFAYNATFDKKHLPEFSQYVWYDIMRLAAYRQYNRSIPASADCFQTGRLRRGYGVEAILKMLRRDDQYCESHNAAMDARDELEIMRLLGYGLQEYEIARIADQSTVPMAPQNVQTGDLGEEKEGANKKKGIWARIFGRR